MYKYVLLFLIFSVGALKAQTPLCPPNLNEGVWEDYERAGYWWDHFSSWGNVDCKWRINNGRYEVKADWSTMNQHDGYGFSEADFQMMLRKGIIDYLLKEGPLNQQYGILQVVFYETTQCRSTRKCYLKLDQSIEIICADAGWPGPNPETYTHQGVKYLVSSTSVNCGTQCCEFVYNVEHSLTVNSRILGVTKNPAPGSQCDQLNLFDCKTGAPIICNSSCN